MLQVGNIAGNTLDLMRKLNVSFEGRGSFDKKLRGSTPPFYDACFIDGDHGYLPVRHDYAQMAPRCRAAMFHDIQDSSTMLNDNHGGGVPMFWAHARAHVARSRVAELTMQYAPYWPVFGIGVLLPGPAGTAEPDDGIGILQWPKYRGDGPAALWAELCGKSSMARLPGSDERLPEAYVAREVLCPHVNASNLKDVLAATKRSVARPLLEYAMALPWRGASPIMQ